MKCVGCERQVPQGCAVWCPTCWNRIPQLEKTKFMNLYRRSNGNPKGYQSKVDQIRRDHLAPIRGSAQEANLAILSETSKEGA